MRNQSPESWGCSVRIFLWRKLGQRTQTGAEGLADCEAVGPNLKTLPGQGPRGATPGGTRGVTAAATARQPAAVAQLGGRSARRGAVPTDEICAFATLPTQRSPQQARWWPNHGRAGLWCGVQELRLQLLARPHAIACTSACLFSNGMPFTTKSIYCLEMRASAPRRAVSGMLARACVRMLDNTHARTALQKQHRYARMQALLHSHTSPTSTRPGTTARRRRSGTRRTAPASAPAAGPGTAAPGRRTGSGPTPRPPRRRGPRSRSR